MNACLQCLIAIDEFRDYYINDEWTKWRNTRTVSNSTDYSYNFTDFMNNVFKHDAETCHILNPTGLKNLIRKKFYPSMQHDSHEFLMHVMSSL
jgi:ubiquitin C-terminal hydrolase